MILLNGRSLTPKRKVPLETMSLMLKERESTASITPGDMTGIQVNSWLKDETEPGKGIVWRVRSIAQAYATRTPTVQLEHLIATLKDDILFGEHKAAQITGNKKATTCTAEQAVRYILKRQSDWVLGTFDYQNVSNPYKFDGDTLFEALETVTGSLEGARWTYDFSTYPFKLNIVRKATAVGSELRAGRNLKTITKTIDKSGMFTRFYPIGKADLHLDSEYAEKNVSLYGVISKTETDQSISDKAELKRWAEERLRDHAEPTVTIDVEGVELADATGVSLDRLKLGVLCRVPLPEFGTTFTEEIVSITYQDKIRQPAVFKATLANNKTDITKILAEVIRKGGGGGRAAAKQEKEDMAWFEDTNDHVAMCAKGIVGVDAQGNPNWIRLTQLYVDGNGLESTVQSIQNGQVVQQTRLEQNERSIGMVVETSPDGKTKIKAAEITASINNGSTNIKLKADHIDIDGLVEKLETRTLGVGGLHVEGFAEFYKKAEFEAGLMSEDKITTPSIEVGNQMLNVADATVDGNVLTITYVNGNTVNFSKATSLSGEWSSNKWTVTASPQGNTIAVLPQVHAVSSQGGNYTNVYVGTHDGSNWTNHGSATKLTLGASGLTVNLTDPNGSILATISAENPYPSSASMTQHQNAAGTKNFTAYYLAPDGVTYVSMGQHYWYHSGSNIGSRTVHY